MTETHNQYIKRWLSSSKNEPPLLIHTPSVSMADSVMHDVRMLSVCTTQQDIACGQCQPCLLAQDNKHPDVILFSDTNELPADVKELREQLAQFHRTSFNGRRLVILHQPEKYSIVMLNLLLKPLEESSLNTHYLLVSHLPKRLPATIRSRCSILYIPGERTAFEDTDVQMMQTTMQQMLVNEGPSSALRNAFWRLRDYYKIRQAKGNEKLAKEILVASVSRLKYHT